MNPSLPVDDCPSPEDLVAFVAGRLDPVTARTLESHVDGCHDCRELLSALARAAHATEDALASAHRPLAPSQLSLSPTLPFRRDDAGCELPLGARVGRYEVLERLGAGAMGVVYAARDPDLHRKVALKLLRNDASGKTPHHDRLLSEAQAMAQLAHPNVVAVYDVGSVGEHVFVAMELVEGQTLRQWLAAAPRSLGEVLHAFVAAGRGLAAAHAAGLVHRDFKPDNVLVGHDGRIRVTDFGLAHDLAHRAGPTDEIAGTPYYMAPEQYRGEATDARSDQFSFCVALASALAGAHPFGADAVAWLAGGATPRPPRPALGHHAVPRWLRRLLRRGLALSPDDRHPSMDALLAQLSSDRSRRRWRRLGVAATVAALLGAGGLAVRWRYDRQLCGGAERKLAGVWDPARAHAIEHAFVGTGQPNAARAFVRVARLLDGYTRRWAAMHTQACEATRVRGEQPAALLAARTMCLEARLREVRGLTAALAQADGAAVDGAAAATQGLGALGICADEQALAATTGQEGSALVAPAVLDGDGTLHAFVHKAGGALWHGWQDPARGGWREATLADGVVGNPAVAVDGTGQLGWFARKSDGSLWHGWQLAPGSDRWQEVRLLDAVDGDPAVVLDGDARLVWFVRRSDGSLWYGRQEAAGSRRFSVRTVTDAVIGQPAVVLGFDRRLSYFVRRADGSLWHGWEAQPGGGTWAENKRAESAAGDPAAALEVDQRLTYVVRRIDGSLIAGYQDVAGGEVWHAVKLTDGVAGDPSVAFDVDRRVVCMVRKTDGSLWHGWQAAPGRGPWEHATLADGVTGDPALARDAADRLHYFVRKSDGALWQGWRESSRHGPWHDRALTRGLP